MAVGVSATLGTPVPSRKHAVSVQLPTWKNMVALGNGDAKTIKALKGGYPRSILHHDVQNLAKKCRMKLPPSTRDLCGLSIFPDFASAEACESYLINDTLNGVNSISSTLVRKVVFTFERSSELNNDFQDWPLDPLWAVVYPESATPSAACFWRLTGLGISSRRAEAYLMLVKHMRCSDYPGTLPEQQSDSLEDPVYGQLRDRIASLLTTSTADSKYPSSSDVFLYPSGMSAIFHVHRTLLKWKNSESVVFGFPYELTLKMLQTFGPSYKFLSSGSDEELGILEQYLCQRSSQNSKHVGVQAIWCECPSNPLLWTPDLQRVRRLADEYDLIVVVDDTIGTFANVNVLDVADVVITSLTKSFNGFADVLAGSAAINSRSRHYHELKRLLDASYINNLYIEDAVQLEINSRTFLERVACTNETAEYLVDYLRALKSGCTSSGRLIDTSVQSWDHVISAIHFPKGSPSEPNYIQQMRPSTTTFKPGYGCMFTIEFCTVDVAAKFFDAVEFHKGPSLGADVTLAQPYVQMVLQREKEWAASHGVRETIVRISVGLEDKECLLGRLQRALVATYMSTSSPTIAAVL